jgi:FKBP-type peptidyl-prolyl cis-trans isomerase SlyD
VLEERTPENPFILEFGKGQTLPAVEGVIRGKTEGFEASIGVAAKEAYGEFDDELVTSVPISTFPKPSEVQVGMKYSTVGPLGEEITVRVVEVIGENATVDGNHPLAGLDIEIDLKILEVEAMAPSATETADDSEMDPADDTVPGFVLADDDGDEEMDDEDDEESDLDTDDGDESGGAGSGGRLLH